MVSGKYAIILNNYINGVTIPFHMHNNLIKTVKTKIKNKFTKTQRRNNYDNSGELLCSCNKSRIGKTNRNFKIRYKEQRKFEIE